ncbi:hypothetical protein SSX86_005246 [Deinandra increscens subsp. villosa]|uniref:PHD-type domain-containing protein n=1 Tax=Deinandra increscens subsp. villosa TaxID=3103831 RepID=A0AAP0DLK7_9ASTR
MREVEGSERSEAVVKTKSSSGCLIVEKKATYGVGGVLGFSGSPSRKLFDLNKEKKRSRVVLSDSESSDELTESVRRKVYRLGTGLVENDDFQAEKRFNNELDDSDELDERTIRKDVNNDRHKLMLHRQIGNKKESASGSSRMIFDNKVDLYSNNKSSILGAKENDECNILLSVSHENEEEDFDGTVGLHENNGGLKIMVNENKQKESGTGIRSPSIVKMVKRDANTKARMKHVTSVKNKENKSQRASYTEKQLLREKIKNMLLGAGWTIDYRPRRNRDYLDSVYISPSGSAYWSITKAYDTLKKEERESSKAGGDFTPLPTEILCKLTRVTRKKIEKEIEKNRVHEGKSRKSKRAKVKRSAAHDKASDLSERRRGEESRNSDKGTTQKHGLKESTIHTHSHIVQEEKSRNIGRLTLLVRGSDTWLNSEDNGSVQYSGKRTLLSWLIDSEMVSDGEKVEYMNLRKTRVMQEGWITEDGIHCDCCSKIITISRFELHAGSKLGQPFQNIFIGSGKSLMQCQIDGWNKQKESERRGFHSVHIDGDDPNDDTCGICGDGGDLICCDGCPSTFHLSCLNMQMLPQGDWHCPNCACRYCERVGRYGTKASGRTENSLLTCRLCEKKYHKSCSPETNDMPFDSSDLNFPFCEQKCRELYNRLQKLLWIKHELDSGFSWSLIHRSDPLPDASSANFSQRVESNSKLAIAQAVMDECFLPIVDTRSGISLIHNVVYNCGSNFSRLNYSGFFTAILEKGDEMICAASIRIHGTQLAEMPFIGTRHLYRRQGMCRRLLNAIESALSSLKVEKLVIPAIEEHLHTWTNAFGFSPVEKSQKQEMRSFNMLVFPGTDMLHKSLTDQGTPKGNITSEKGKNGVDVEDYSKSLGSELSYAAKQNGDSSTGNPSEPENHSSVNKSDEKSDPNVLTGLVLEGNEIREVSGGADSSSKVEALDLQNGNGMAIRITDANLLQPPVPDGTANDYDPISAHSGFNDSSLVEPGFQFSAKETDSVDAGSMQMEKENEVRDATNRNA